MTALKIADVQLDANPPYLHIRKAKFYKSRMVPVHPTTAGQLRAYLEQRNRAKLQRPSTALFITGMGRPLSYSTLRYMFVPLLQSAGIQHNDGGRGPFLHSFRHYAASRTMPRVGVGTAIYRRLGRSDAA